MRFPRSERGFPRTGGLGDTPNARTPRSGAGIAGGEYLLVTVPMGASAGRAWSSGSVRLSPYVAVGLALALRLGGDAPRNEFRMGPSADLGLDLSLDGNRSVILRPAVSLGDRQAVAPGLDVSR